MAFFVARIFLMVVIGCEGFDPHAASTWQRGDSGHYIQISQSGYNFYVSDGADGYPKGAYMGNTGWMPLYPLMIRAVADAGISSIIAGILLSAIFHFAALVLLWNRFLLDVPSGRAFACLLLAAFFPGQVYQHAIFPISLMTFLALLCVDQVLAKGWWRAGVAGFFAAAAYSTGFLLAPVIAFFLLIAPGRQSLVKRVAPAAIVGGMTMLGLAVVLLGQQIAVGHWNAFFLVQQKYGYGLHNPAMTVLKQLKYLWRTEPISDGRLAEIVVVTAAIGVSLMWGAMTWRRRPGMDRLLLIYAAVYCMFPLMMGVNAQPMRAAACLMPVAPLARRLPSTVQVLFVMLGATLSVLTLRAYLWVPAL